ncbi:LPXTG-motif cell wall-anchored protein [Mycetocola sp. CAN_C7]
MKTRTKLLAGFNASILFGAALVLAAGAAPASAHTPEVDATCESVTLTLENYGHTPEAPTPNTVTVTIDGVEQENTAFGAGFAASYDFDDVAVGHEWAVVVDAADDTYDRSFDGTTEPCAPAVPADASATVTVEPPTCDIPARLVLGDVVNATWSTPTATTGPADYSVVATADEGHLFASGETTETFSGRLDGQLDSVEAGCATLPGTVPPMPEPVVTTDAVEAEDCTTDTITTTTTTVTTGHVFDEVSNTWVTAEPVTTVTSTDRAATQVECPTPAQTVASELPSTGADSSWLVAVAGLLVAAGVALMATRRIRRA